MSEENRIYAAIDLKSFYASVECVERGLDPLTTNLVVADVSRTQKTICLAVSPALKSYGIPGRARLFEVVSRVDSVNTERLALTNNGEFIGKSCNNELVKSDKNLALDFIAAVPQMAHYMQVSTRIYKIYLRYIAPEDIHVYSVDEVFIDLTSYLNTYKMTAKELTMKMINEVYNETGITATAGIGTNLYLAKIAMDIVAKHIPPDENGVRMAELDEMSYRQTLWAHTPITDFWRVGRGYAKKLHEIGIDTMGDIARCSIGAVGDYYNEELLYKLFGINAELLIDHAWGYEPCRMSDIKAYRAESKSLCSGQVLHCPYNYEQTRLVVREMADLIAYDLADKSLVTNQIILTVGYDIENLTNESIRKKYRGAVTTDSYGRAVPKHAHGTVNLTHYTSSAKSISEAAVTLYDRIINKNLLVRRLNITVNDLREEGSVVNISSKQLDLFGTSIKDENDVKCDEKELKLQKAVVSLKKRFGKNAVVKAMNLQKDATAMQRNSQIGGHKA